MIKRKLAAVFLALSGSIYVNADVTVEQCVSMATENYPLIQKYDILNKNLQTELSDINKSWLPQIGVYAQGTAQNVVPGFPDALSQMLDQAGAEVSGLGKLQYRIGAELNQTIWDGGTSKAKRAIAESVDAQNAAAVDVELYAVREKAENLFFGILLLEEQIKQVEQTERLLAANLDRLRKMKSNGTAMQSDLDMVEAQMLSVRQQIILAQSQAQSYRRLLGLYIGKDITTETLIKPSPSMPTDMTPDRPEMALFNAGTNTNEARLGSIKSSVMPRIDFFAQAYYGYPGYDYFKSMMERDLSFNAIAGIKITWNIGAFYSKKNSELKIRLKNNNIATDRNVFLFNTDLQTESQTAHIAELERIIKEDSRIVELRCKVRRAAESQLNNGVIDATDLLAKITDENQARIASSYHEIQLIQSIYKLKYILNR